MVPLPMDVPLPTSNGTLKTAVFLMVDLPDRNLLHRAVNVPPTGLGNQTKAAALLISLLETFLPLSVTTGGTGLMPPTLVANKVDILLPLLPIIIPLAPHTMVIGTMEATMAGPIGAQLSKNVGAFPAPSVLARKVWLHALCMV